MFDEFLLLCTALVGVALLRSSRRSESRPRAYAWVLAAILGLTLVAVAESSRFVGFVAIAMAVLVVAVPWVLEWVARVCFGRGLLRAAVWAAGLRAVLMLGAGLGRQQQVLRGLAVLERDGADAAIVYFRGLAQTTDDDGELALINEQIVSMLLYGQRWNESIAHYESRFHPGHAAMRPALVLGLMRAYGEVGALERAAALLQALEDGPVGHDPRALGLVSQARLTFLVYAGAQGCVHDALAPGGRRQLGLSEASGALYRGLVARQAGDAGKARCEFERVPELAGRRDDRVVASARRAMGELGAPPVVLDPVAVGEELIPYVDAVAARLRAFIKIAPTVKRSGALVATPALLAVMGLAYFVVRWLDDGGLGLLQAGATLPELSRGNSVGALLTGLWVHGDPLGLLVTLYTIWSAAPLVERIAGTGRTFGIAVLCHIVATLTSAWLGPQFGMVLGGGGGAACGLLGAAVILVVRPIETVRGRDKRRLWIPLAMVAVAQAVTAIPGFLAVEMSWHGLLAATMVGAALGLLPSAPRADSIVAGLLALVCVALGVQNARKDPLDSVLSLPPTAHLLGPVAVHAPSTFERIDAREDVPGLPLPVQIGLLDGLALRAGDMVQVSVVVPEHGASLDTPALLLLDPSLDAELRLVPIDVPPALGGEGVDGLRAHAVRRNGVELGVTVSRLVGPDPSGPRLVLFAARSALERQGAVYARVLSESGAESPRSND